MGGGGSVLCLVIAIIVLGSSSVLGRTESVTEPAKCHGAPDYSCSAFRSLKILFTGGSCTGKPYADCKAVRRSQSELKRAFGEWFTDSKALCDSNKAGVAAITVATAVAEVWANAAAKVECEGMGFACGWTISDGNTFARAFAEAIVQAAAEAGTGQITKGFCFADLRALSTVLATAAVDVTGDVCTTGGSAEDFPEYYVRAVQVEIVNAFANATGHACVDDTDGIAASSKCSDTAESSQGDIIKYGDVCGGLEQLKPCTGKVNSTCCAPDFTRAICTCEECDGPWILDRDRDVELCKVFANQNGDDCYCKDITGNPSDVTANEDLSALV